MVHDFAVSVLRKFVVETCFWRFLLVEGGDLEGYEEHSQMVLTSITMFEQSDWGKSKI